MENIITIKCKCGLEENVIKNPYPNARYEFFCNSHCYTWGSQLVETKDILSSLDLFGNGK